METKEKTRRERIDALLDAMGSLIETDDGFCVDFYSETDLSVHLFSGIEELAAAHNMKPTVEVRDNEEYPWELSVIINGTKFFQIEDEAGMEKAVSGDDDA